MIDSRAMRERRHLNQGFGRALSQAMEIALVPAVLAFLGYGIDRLLGTRFVVATIFAILALVGTGVKMYYGYRFEMEQHDRTGAWHHSASKVDE